MVTSRSIVRRKAMSVNPSDIKASRSVFAAPIISSMVETISFSFFSRKSLGFSNDGRASDSIQGILILIIGKFCVHLEGIRPSQSESK